MRSGRTTRLLAAWATVLALAVAGCSSADDDPAVTSDPSRSASTGQDPVYDFPLEAYRLTTKERSAGLGATSVLINKCAARYGISLDLRSDVVLHSDFSITYYNDLRPVTVASARSLGYHLPQTPPPAATNALATLTPRESEVVSGWSKFLPNGLPEPKDPFLRNGGCAGEAARKLDGPSASSDPTRSPQNLDSNYVLGLIQQSTQRAETAPAFLGKVASWSSCMAGAGYSDLHQLTDAIGHYDLNMPLTAAERNEAVQDATCKGKVGLLPVWVDLVGKYQRSLISTNSGRLELVKGRIRSRLENASTVLGR